jgi:hypothetical protein
VADQLPLDNAEPNGAGVEEVWAAPASSASQPDPLVERLLATERRKAEQRQLSSPPPPESEAPPPPRVASEPPRAAASAVVDVPVALTRWLSEQAPTNPRWLDMDRGTHRALISLRLRDGRLIDYDIEMVAPRPLRDVLAGALFYLGKRHLPGGSVHAPSGQLKVIVEAKVSQDAAVDSSERLPAIRHFTTDEGSYLPRARVRLPDGRRIDLRVSSGP